MGLRWLDGFDHYGADESLLTDGVYADTNNVELRTDNPRTGAHQLRIGAANDGGVRRIFGDDFDEIGLGYAFYIPALPADSYSMALAQFRNNGNVAVATIGVTSTGQVTLWRGVNRIGAFGTLLATSAPVVLAESYQHFECRMASGVGDGACEVRLNGVTVLNVAGVNTAGADGILAQVQIGAPGSVNLGFPGYMDLDDLFAWDTLSGTENNDFVGDKKVYTGYPDADTATEEWDPSTGVDSFSMLDNAPPDDDTLYLAADSAPTRSVFGLSDLPGTVVSIAGAMLATRAWKTDAGNAKVVVGMISDGVEEVGAEHALSMAPTYYHDVFETDPDTGTLWTLAGINAAQSSLERTE